MLKINTKVKELEGCLPDDLPESLLNSSEPVLLKGLVANWPIVQAGLKSVKEADEYLRSFYKGTPVVVYSGGPEIEGRVFYGEDFKGFNYDVGNVELTKVLDKLLEHLETDPEVAPTYYVGSTGVDNWLPGFRQENDISLNSYKPLVSIWIGNRSRISAHFDFPDNIACCVVGKRRFTVFPPDQLKNLYVGPLDLTPSGQAISLVDFSKPDFEKYPRFKEAVEHAQVAEMEPGDALFLPSMWWHHVESLSAYNALVNYWWRNTPSYLGGPINVLNHALMSIRNLPKEQRKAWQNLFNQYVFDADEEDIAHIPEHVRGVLAPMDEMSARKMRAQLLNKLNR